MGLFKLGNRFRFRAKCQFQAIQTDDHWALPDEGLTRRMGFYCYRRHNPDLHALGRHETWLGSKRSYAPILVWRATPGTRMGGGGLLVANCCGVCEQSCRKSQAPHFAA